MKRKSDTAKERVLAHCADCFPGVQPSRIYFAPGRINLIGDHIDYLGGTVLPVTIDRGTVVAALTGMAPGLRVHALDEGSTTFDVEWRSCVRHEDWRDFVAGILRAGGAVSVESAPGAWDRGLDLVVSGDLEGGGLSSSASFTLSLASALMDAGFIPDMRGTALAEFARRVEIEQVGTACGIMDQMTIVHGGEQGALVLDCSTLAHRPLPLAWPARGRELLAIHSGVARRLADGIYNRRRTELAEGLSACGVAADRIPGLAEDAMTGAVWTRPDQRRVRHVVSEQARVVRAIAAAERQDWSTFGAAMTASHASLRDDFEVSVAELDALVAAATATPGCDGARLTGAGLGGWAIALVKADARAAVLDAVAKALGVDRDGLDWFVARPGGAVRALPSTAADRP